MPYTAEISRSNPSCFLFLVDQSGSMEDGWAGEAGKQKADGLATIINRLLQNLVLKCAKSEGVRDYYHVGVIGYGGSVGPAFGGALAGKELAPISAIANLPARIEERTKKTDDGAGGLVEQTVKFPVWFDPVAKGGTPMSQALTLARQVLTGWLAQHPSGFPPIVINITDGEATDGDPSSAATALRDLQTDDGQALLFNLHLSSHQAAPVQFPSDAAALPDKWAKLLFNLSSPLPPFMREIAGQEGFPVSEGTRGFAFNADMVTVIQFLDIGTRPNNLR
ncbi:MAG: VWA domain-containing protein [Thermomicrobiales bacterium]